jgi:predicted permease
MSWISRMVNAFCPRRVDADLEEELRFHAEQRVGDLVRDGVSQDEAERMALRRLGSPLPLRESSHDVKSALWLESFLRDLRFGLRMLVRDRTSSLAAIASLALALGACTTAFALIDALILRTLPLPAPHRLIDIVHVMPAFFSPENKPHESGYFTYRDFELFRHTARDYADLFADGGLRPVLFDDAEGAGESVFAELISGRGFEILGVQPALGRLIQPADDSPAEGHPVAVLSYPFWKRRFGGNPGALGHWVMMGRMRFQIVGVAAPSFTGLQPGNLTNLWVPLTGAEDAQVLANPDNLGVSIWGRLHPGATASQLRDPLQAALTNLRRERASINPPRNLHGDQLRQFTDAPLHVHDAARGGDSLFRMQFRRPLGILALICGLLLLVACSNVANLMLARASARETELAIRVSLGAGRARLIQQMLIESGQLVASAAVLAILFAVWAAPVMVARLGTTEYPAWLDVANDSRTLVFAVGLSLVSALIVGTIPALRASLSSPDATLKAGGVQRTGRVGPLRWLLAAQIGFSVSVVFLSGLLLLSFRKLITVDLGFSPRNVVLFDLAARDPAGQRPNSGAQLLETIRQLPAVESASLSQQRPMGGDMVWIMEPVIHFPGRAKETVRPVEVPVSAGFCSALGIRWIAGRDFLPDEIASKSAAVIVNQAFVDKFLAGRNPLGETFEKLGDDPDPVRQQIIGVVANARYNNVRESEGPVIYSPLRNIAGATLNVRTASQPASLIPWLRKNIEAAAPEMRVDGSILLSSQVDNTMIRERLLALLAAFFSAVALLLGGVGIYGVMNYGVVRRTREIGIRIALGAQRSAVVRLIVSSASAPLLAGIALGIAAGLGMARYLSAQLFGIQPTDFWSLATPLGCVVIASAAGVLPPARVLR